MFSSLVSVEPQYGQRKPRFELDELQRPACRGAGGAKPEARELLAPLPA